MIQFNLLPDVKKEYIRANRTKRIIISVSLLASLTAITVVFLLFIFVQVGQKSSIDDLSEDIKVATDKINETENLDSMLTTQNQLSLSPELHENKPETSRIFDIISFVSPLEVKLKALSMSTEASTMELSGNADSVATVNLFVDNIKAAQYALTDEDDTRQPVFSEVTTTLNGSDQGATFIINLSFDPLIFDNKNGLLMSIGDQELVLIREGASTNEQ